MNGISCALEGRVGQDAELRYTAQGKALLNFSVGVIENRTSGDGSEITWIRVSLWEADAERLAPVLKKGVEVYVEGRLKLNSWTAADGTECTGLNVSAWLCQPLGQIGRRKAERDAIPRTQRTAVGM